MTNFDQKHRQPFQHPSQSAFPGNPENATIDDDTIEPANRHGFNMWSALQTVFSVAIVIATIFTGIHPTFFQSNLDDCLNLQHITQTKPTSSR